MGSKATFTFSQCIEEYTKPGSVERHGLEVLFNGGALNRNEPIERAKLRGVIRALRDIAFGIERDGMLGRNPKS